MKSQAIKVHLAASRADLFILLILFFCSSVLFSPPTHGETLSCDETHQIDVRFNNGTAWSMCWTSNLQENIVLSEIHYQPNNQQPIPLISSIRLAQLHVTYDDSLVTYNDVTQFGLGGGYISTLLESDCEGGELLNISDRAGLCKQVTSGGEAFHTEDEIDARETLSLYSISLVGAYAYLVTWKFHNDGSIEPSVGAAGALQRSASHNHEHADDHSDHGRELEGDSEKIWLSHTHNYYWRIDFDIGHNAIDDVVTEVSYPVDASGRRPKKLEELVQETAREINPDELTSWYITDSADDILQAPGYLIEPIRYGHKLVRQEQEPYTNFDFFVTRQNDCEQFINENSKFNPDCGDDILQYTNNESLENQDIVVWHRISFHHVPRNEDKKHMHSHWDGFVMQARNLSSVTPGHSGFTSNTAPTIEPMSDQINQVGDVINSLLIAEDSDNDHLSYTHASLPSGLRISEQGRIEGTIDKAGHYDTTVAVSDGIHKTTTHIKWQVKSLPKKGTIGSNLVIVLMLWIICRNEYSFNPLGIWVKRSLVSKFRC